MAWYNKLGNTVKGSVFGPVGTMAGAIKDIYDNKQAEAKQAQTDAQNQAQAAVPSPQYKQDMTNTRKTISDAATKYTDKYEGLTKEAEQGRSSYLGNLQSQIGNYLDKTGNAEGNFQAKQVSLNEQAKNYAENSAKFYNNTIQPQMKNLMEQQNSLVNKRMSNAMMAPTLDDYSSSLNEAARGYNEAIGQFKKDTDAATNSYYDRTKQAYDQYAGFTNAAAAEYKAQQEAEVNRYRDRQEKDLARASDPNNQTVSQMRGVYDQLISQGQADVDKEMGRSNAYMAGTRNQGYQDYGTLSALGAQALQNTARGAPMTGAQLGQAQQSYNAAASTAMQTALKRVQDIEDQQRQYEATLQTKQLDYAKQAREQGLTQGLDQSWKQYNAGDAMAAKAMDAALQSGQFGLTNKLNAYNTGYQGQLGAFGTGLQAQLGNYGTGLNASKSYADMLRENAGMVYGKGQEALGAYGSALDQSSSFLGQMSALDAQNQAQQAGYRGEQGAYGANILASQNQVANNEYSLNRNFQDTSWAAQEANRAEEEAVAARRYANTLQEQMMLRTDLTAEESAKLAAQSEAAAKAAAAAEASAGQLASIFQTIGTVGSGIVGGIYGGPLGAAGAATAGNAVFGGLGNALFPSRGYQQSGTAQGVWNGGATLANVYNQRNGSYGQIPASSVPQMSPYFQGSYQNTAAPSVFNAGNPYGGFQPNYNIGVQR